MKTRQKEKHMAMLELDLCSLFFPVHFPSLTIPCLDDAEQIETDIASARETLADASAWVDKLHGELSRSWTKSQRVKYVRPLSSCNCGPHVLTVHIHIHRRSTVRWSAA